MRVPSLVLAAVALCDVASAQAPAPSPLGTVAQVRGLVTMSLGTRVATVQRQTPVFDGARFVASSSGSAELKFDNGCVLKLDAGQWVTIDRELDCPRQIAAIQWFDATAGALPPVLLPVLGSALLAGIVATLPDPQITPTPR